MIRQNAAVAGHRGCLLGHSGRVLITLAHLHKLAAVIPKVHSLSQDSLSCAIEILTQDTCSRSRRESSETRWKRQLRRSTGLRTHRETRQQGQAVPPIPIQTSQRRRLNAETMQQDLVCTVMAEDMATADEEM